MLTFQFSYYNLVLEGALGLPEDLVVCGLGLGGRAYLKDQGKI